MSERKTKTNHTGKHIRNFLIVEKTPHKKQRKDGRNFYIYICRCDCGVEFESNAAEFEYIFGCKKCSKQHHYESTAKSQKITKHKNPSRRTILSKIYPETYKNIKGSYANYIIGWIKGTAKKRKLEWNLNDVYAFELIRQPCNYCGTTVNFPETRNGLDRIDSSKGYAIDNVVPCCYTCNIAKHQMNNEEFQQYIIKVYEHLIKKK